jgi:hypothetical protein
VTNQDHSIKGRGPSDGLPPSIQRAEGRQDTRSRRALLRQAGGAALTLALGPTAALAAPTLREKSPTGVEFSAGTGPSLEERAAVQAAYRFFQAQEEAGRHPSAWVGEFVRLLGPALVQAAVAGFGNVYPLPLVQPDRGENAELTGAASDGVPEADAWYCVEELQRAVYQAMARRAYLSALWVKSEPDPELALARMEARDLRRQFGIDPELPWGTAPAALLTRELVDYVAKDERWQIETRDAGEGPPRVDTTRYRGYPRHTILWLPASLDAYGRALAVCSVVGTWLFPKSYWPDHFTAAELEAYRQELGQAFAVEYLSIATEAPGRA